MRCGGRKVNEDAFLEKVYKIWKEKKDQRFVSFSFTACDKLEDGKLSDLLV